MKPIDAVSWKRCMSISATPGGAVGWTSTGSDLRVDRGPDRRERRIGERLPSDVREHHDPGRSGCGCTIEFGERQVRILPRQRREPAQAVRMRGARSRHIVVHDACGVQADLGTAPVAVGTGERHDADVDAAFVHRREPQVVVEHRRHGRHEWRAVEVDRAKPPRDGLDGVARSAVLLQEVEPRLGEAVRVDVDNRAHGQPSSAKSSAGYASRRSIGSHHGC